MLGFPLRQLYADEHKKKNFREIIESEMKFFSFCARSQRLDNCSRKVSSHGCERTAPVHDFQWFCNRKRKLTSPPTDERQIDWRLMNQSLLWRRREKIFFHLIFSSDMNFTIVNTRQARQGLSIHLEGLFARRTAYGLTNPITQVGNAIVGDSSARSRC